MKNILKFVIVLFACYNAYGQQLVQTISDVYKLKENKDQFINKPLKDLLKEIKPPIKTAHVFNDDYPLFIFKFTTIEQQRKDEGSISDRISLFVYVKNPIPWNWSGRAKGSELNWTVDDKLKFSDFIVTNISIVYPKD
ncbi:hypothetical protein C8C83_1725 [Flavobacterium sp. 90]|uniref:hypothetical protein n=1 Tax=unclassified Flavobacterium TaxID=196869 RepID=UPI000EB1761A|nr:MULTISPECIES: hypothetical protein [unclassified Flavobacterium]RKR10057.1 hypothetical protein C8C82_2027 [Flavobacterium sp. 81]TCK53842.1 hypothetical protein C8C83_1725 [Flavobacterium sp. 90]